MPSLVEAISFLVAVRVASSFRVMIPAPSSSSRARPSLVGSLGTAMVTVSASAETRVRDKTRDSRTATNFFINDLLSNLRQKKKGASAPFPQTTGRTGPSHSEMSSTKTGTHLPHSHFPTAQPSLHPAFLLAFDGPIIPPPPVIVQYDKDIFSYRF